MHVIVEGMRPRSWETVQRL